MLHTRFVHYLIENDGSATLASDNAMAYIYLAFTAQGKVYALLCKTTKQVQRLHMEDIF